MHFQPILNGLDENHTSGFPSLSILRDPPQLRFSTQGPHTHGIENPGPPPPQPLPRLSSALHFSQQDLEWWSSELSNGDISASRPRLDAPSRGVTDYIPPRNWVDAPVNSRDRRMGASSTFSGASWTRRRDIARSGDPRPRHGEVVDDASDEDRPTRFPSIVHRYEQERSVLERRSAAHIPLSPPSGPSEAGHHGEPSKL
jgi:hypothetical protein